MNVNNNYEIKQLNNGYWVIEDKVKKDYLAVFRTQAKAVRIYKILTEDFKNNITIDNFWLYCNLK